MSAPAAFPRSRERGPIQASDAPVQGALLEEGEASRGCIASIGDGSRRAFRKAHEGQGEQGAEANEGSDAHRRPVRYHETVVSYDFIRAPLKPHFETLSRCLAVRIHLRSRASSMRIVVLSLLLAEFETRKI